jgi:hypothetical protein
LSAALRRVLRCVERQYCPLSTQTGARPPAEKIQLQRIM